MEQIKRFATLMFILLAMVGVTSCEKDEPGSSSSHDYFTAEVAGTPSYYWVIDMDHQEGAGYDGSFKIMAWTLDGKKMSGKNSYSGKYSVKNSTIYVTWDHQSMNTMWQFVSDGIRMTGSSNPEEFYGLTFYYGAPEFE